MMLSKRPDSRAVDINLSDAKADLFELILMLHLEDPLDVSWTFLIEE